MPDPTFFAALRSYPLFTFDRSRVEVRAYFLGQKHGDHLANWLEAERIESDLQGKAALAFPPTGSDFLTAFRLKGHVRFVTNEPRSKEVWGSGVSPVRCAICAGSEPRVSFSTDAHLLPACTGNRFLMTAHECDDCNLDGGKETENELGAFLAPLKALHRIQGRRKPSTKHKPERHGSHIGGQQRDEPLNVTLVDGSAAVEFEDINESTVQITAKGQPFDPVKALRSLGRSAWHLLDDQGGRHTQDS